MTQVPNVGQVVHAGGTSEGGSSNGKGVGEASGFEGILGGLMVTQVVPVQIGDSSIAEAEEEAAPAIETASEGAADVQTDVENITQEGASAGAAEDQAQAPQASTEEQGKFVTEQVEKAEVIASVLSAAVQADAGDPLCRFSRVLVREAPNLVRSDNVRNIYGVLLPVECLGLNGEEW